MNPFDDTAAPHRALVNEEGQYSLWPAGFAVPAGWRTAFGPDTRAACLRYVEDRWSDPRPRSLVREADGAAGTVPPAPGELPCGLFEEQAARTPGAPALESADARLTYGELNTAANRLAHHLAARGVGPESVVALVLPRSADLIVALLAVLKAGAAYLPVDTAYPAERIEYLLRDARPACVIATAETAAGMPGDSPGTGLVLLDDPAVRREVGERPGHDPRDEDRTGPLLAGHPAYVVYTSGSTGRPKGIAMPCRGLTHLLVWHRAALPGGPGTRTAQFTAIGFDFSVQEILGTLVAGKTLVIPTDDLRRDPAGLVEWIDRHRVNELYAPTAAIEAVLAAAQESGSDLATLTDVYQGGEALNVEGQIRDFALRSPFRLHNVYGPAEVHVATFHTAPDDPADWPASAPLGPSIPDVPVRVLDEELRPVAPGEAGELYIAGPQVSRGYRNRPDLTAARFVADPMGPPGSRMYRTGDLGRWNADGHAEFIGRTDDQVKIRGFRVEPGEVEAVLVSHPEVAQAAVVARNDRPGGPRLVAYVVGGADAASVRRHAAGSLPEYMVPSAVVLLPEFPLAPNGKVDRRALPAPEDTPSAGASAGREARTDRERVLCELFAEVLRVRAVGVDDHFFELGGHSLMAGRLTARIRAVLGCRIPIRRVYESPTPATLAALLDGPPS
ncbi:hypothetical protein GCM10010420_00180 [Streptomyces glaucosporus]|uniref:Carrier domain-containing protein n=1 Tax=Streptomyces glaucosporus TaxID=284044 RepID=A0ABN3HK48_9ACTN